MEKSVKEIAEFVGGSITGDPSTVIKGVAGIEDAEKGDITFVSNPKYIQYIKETRASAVVCSPEVNSDSRILIKVKNPYLAYAKIIRFLNPALDEPCTVDERSKVGSNVSIGKQVTVYPFVFIGDNAVIEDGAVIYPGCFIGRDVRIGEGSLVHPNVTIREGCIIGKRVIIHSGTVIGSDGFGFARDGAKYHKIPQLGIVQIDDDVEIGACNTIDRAMMGITKISRGVKTDNLVHIAHNVTVGQDTVLVAFVGISGSTKIGSRVIMAGQSSAVGHIKIGDDVIVGARGAISSDVDSGQVVSGAPHMPHRLWLKATRTFEKLPEMRKAIREMEKKIKELESKL